MKACTGIVGAMLQWYPAAVGWLVQELLRSLWKSAFWLRCDELLWASIAVRASGPFGSMGCPAAVCWATYACRRMRA